MTSSRAFFSSTRLELLTLTSSRSLEGVGVMGRIERGGVAVESERDSGAAAGLLFPLAAFFPRAMFDKCPYVGRRGEERKKCKRKREERGVTATGRNQKEKRETELTAPDSTSTRQSESYPRPSVRTSSLPHYFYHSVAIRPPPVVPPYLSSLQSLI
jgi:hypothetical protein